MNLATINEIFYILGLVSHAKCLKIGLGCYISLCVKSVRASNSTDLSLNDALTSFNCNANKFSQKPLFLQGLLHFSYINISLLRNLLVIYA